MHAIVFVMGVSASGKTTLARLLARHYRCDCIDADDLHSNENVVKMMAGIPLTDSDRESWLYNVATAAATATAVHEGNGTLDGSGIVVDGLGDAEKRGITVDTIVACSALRKAYRRQLVSRFNQVTRSRGSNEYTSIFVFLDTAEAAVMTRIRQRGASKGHFMDSVDVAAAQFETLERPVPADGRENLSGVEWRAMTVEPGKAEPEALLRVVAQRLRGALGLDAGAAV